MRRLLLALPLALLATLVWADNPVGKTSVERAERLHRNRGLIQDLVQGSLHLAAADDPLRRADECSELADRLAWEVGEAAAQHEHERAAELSRHLNDLLKKGVATNLTAARKRIPLGSAEEATLYA